VAESLTFGPETYRAGAHVRMKDAEALWDCKRYVGCMYLAGRAVECVFRALITLRERTRLDTGHDLRALMKYAGRLGLLESRDRDILNESIDKVSAIWRNNLRFAGSEQVRGMLKAIKKDRGVRGDFLAHNCRVLLDASAKIVERGDIAWKRSKKS